MSEQILIHFPEAERAAEQLVAQAEAIEQMRHRVTRASDSLFRSGLEGYFVDELDAQLSMITAWLRTCAGEVLESGQDLKVVVAKARELDAECVGLFLSQGELGPASSTERLAQSWDGGYTGWPPDQADIIYINGIWTDYKTHEGYIADIEEKTGRNVLGIHNLSEGYIDPLQAFEDMIRAGNYSRLTGNPAIDSLVRTIEQNPGRPYELMVHSQGAAIASAALCVLAGRGVDLSHLKVTTFGGAGMIYPKGPSYDHYVFSSDFVGVPIALSSMMARSMINVPFETDSVIDNIHVIPKRLPEHSFEMYLDSYSSKALPSISSVVEEREISFQAEQSYTRWQQTTSLGDFGEIDARVMDAGYKADGKIVLDENRLTANARINAQAHLASFNIDADIAGFEVAVDGMLGAEGTADVDVNIDPMSGDAAIKVEAGAFAGLKSTGEIARDFGAVDATARGGVTVGLGIEGNADIGFQNGVFKLDADANAAVLLGWNGGVSVEVDVNEAVETLTQNMTEFTDWLAVQ